MDEELYRAFVAEAEESITELNNSLLDLESNPDDEAAIDDIFRRAHTLKGNFGAMGFDDAATVAHAVEDLLEEVRQGRLEVTPERMDLVFDGVDRIGDILGEIEETGESNTDPSETVAAVREAASAAGRAEASAETAPSSDAAGADDRGESETDGGDAGEGDAEGDDGNDGESEGEDDTSVEPSKGGTDPADGVEVGETGWMTPPAARAEAAAEVVDAETLASVDELYHVAMTLEGGGMKAVDAGLLLGGIPDAVTVAGSIPAMEEIEAGEFDRGFELFVAGLDAEETAETFADLWGVTESTVADVSEAATARAGATAVGEDAAAAPRGEGPSAASGIESARAIPKADSSGRSTSGDSAGDGRSTDDGPTGSAGETRSISSVKSVRVDVDQLDELHELVEQLVTSRIKLRRALDDRDSASDTLDELDKISSNLQSTVMDMRLIPLKKVFDKFPRLVRDLAREQEKRIDFRVEGADIELDRTILDEISDPLMHVLRNAVDHGVEPPADREAAGKPETGTISLSARREHDTVVVRVDDDGGGLDVERIRRKAVDKGVATAERVESLPDEEVFDYIFHPGFSTNDEITDVSGRGVGMDVVKTTVESLDGSVSVSSEPGEGTTFDIRLPVSVAIIKVLFVEVGGRQFGVPLKYIDEIGRLDRVRTINGAEVIVHDDRIFPLIRLREALSIDEPVDDDGMIVRIRPEDRQVALRCDGVTRQEEVVVTPLQGPLSGVEGLGGTSVIGDGNVIPILDAATIPLSESGRRLRRDRAIDGRGSEAVD